MNIGIVGRIAATCIAAIAAVGLTVQCAVLYHQNSSVLLTLWIVFGFFTITTNLLVAVVFTGIAVKGMVVWGDWVVAGTMLAILLVGVIYALLLHGSTELSGGSAVANVFLHMITPVLVPLFWIFFTRKGELTWWHPLLWAIYPLTYLVYGLGRGAVTGNYAYPFMNVRILGCGKTALNVAGIAVAFLISGFAITWVDHRIGSWSWLKRRKS